MKKLIGLLVILGTLSSCNFSKFNTKFTYKEADSNKDGYLSFNEFWSHRKKNEKDKQEAEDKGLVYKDEVRKNFDKADTNKDKKLSKDEFFSCMEKLLRKTNE